MKVSFHTLVLRPDEVDGYLESIRFRREHPEELSQIRYVDVKKEQLEYCKMVVYFEYMPFNLEQVVSLSFDNMTAVLYFALRGF